MEEGAEKFGTKGAKEETHISGGTSVTPWSSMTEGGKHLINKTMERQTGDITSERQGMRDLQ